MTGWAPEYGGAFEANECAGGAGWGGGPWKLTGDVAEYDGELEADEFAGISVGRIPTRVAAPQPGQNFVCGGSGAPHSEQNRGLWVDPRLSDFEDGDPGKDCGRDLGSSNGAGATCVASDGGAAEG